MGSPRIAPLLTEDQLRKRIRELGQRITADYAGKRLVLIAVLKGSFIFLADLCRAIELPLRVEFLGVRSYGAETRSTGVVQITQDLGAPIEGEDVLIVEDIVDSGLTLAHLLELLHTRRPASLKVCVLLDKPDRRAVTVAVDYVGFPIPDRFVVGFGLDWAERHRNLPFVGTVEDR